MKIKHPIQAIASGSLLLGVLVFVVLLIFEMTTSSNFGIASLILIPLLAAGLSFGVFAVIFQKYLGERIRTLYRFISNKKFNDEDFTTSISEDVFTKLEEDTAIWASKQKKQIKELTEQENFRREFLGNLAHELKTPVFSIQGYVLTLLEGGLEDENVNRDFLERALSGVDRISAILEDLDQISKYEFDQFDLKITTFDIVAFTKEIFRELEKKAEDKGIQFRFSENFDVIKVKADQGKIAQVMTNLISNSVSYGKEGGITTVRFHDIDKNKVLIEVPDNGLRMDEKHLPRLFESFYLVSNSIASSI